MKGFSLTIFGYIEMTTSLYPNLCQEALSSELFRKTKNEIEEGRQLPISGGSEAPTSVPTSFVIRKMAIAVVRFEVPSLSAVSVPARKTTREVASAPAGRAGCRAEQDSERSLSLPNLLLLTSILTLFSFGVATKALILAISSTFVLRVQLRVELCCS